MEILLTLTYLFLFIFLIFRIPFFKTEGLNPTGISIILCLKVFFGLILWAIYSFYYKDRSTADIFKYFDDSKIMFDAIHTQPSDYFRMLFGIGNNTPHFDPYYLKMNNWARQYESNLYNDSHTIIRFNALARLISLGYYQVHAVILSFLSLTGLVALYKCFAPMLPGRKKWVIGCVFLFPSVLFWGSGVLKEGILFLGLGMLVYYWFKLWKGENPALSLFWIVISVILLLVTKFYILVSIAPGLLFIAWIVRGGNKHLLIKFGAVMVCYAGLGLGVRYFAPNYDPIEVLSIKQRDFSCLARGGALLRCDTAMVYLTLDQRKVDLDQIGASKTYHIKQGTSLVYWHDYSSDEDTLFGKQGPAQAVFTIDKDMERSGSLITMKPLEPTVSSVLSHTPMALVNTLFRPLPTEARSPLLLMPALEIIAYSVFILFCLLFHRKKGAGMEYLLFCLSFVFILYLITGLTTPVLGAIVRYKVPGIPFLLLGFLFLLDEEKLMKRFRVLKRMKE